MVTSLIFIDIFPFFFSPRLDWSRDALETRFSAVRNKLNNVLSMGELHSTTENRFATGERKFNLNFV